MFFQFPGIWVKKNNPNKTTNSWAKTSPWPSRRKVVARLVGVLVVRYPACDLRQSGKRSANEAFCDGFCGYYYIQYWHPVLSFLLFSNKWLKKGFYYCEIEICGRRWADVTFSREETKYPLQLKKTMVNQDLGIDTGTSAWRENKFSPLDCCLLSLLQRLMAEAWVRQLLKRRAVSG